MNMVLTILLIFFGTAACFVEELYLVLWPPQPGTTVHLTLRCYQPFDFDQQKALGEKRSIAVSEYIPLYSSVPGTADALRVKAQGLLDRIAGLHARKKSEKEFAEYVLDEFDVALTGDVAAALLWYPDINNLVDGILTIGESILQRKVVADPAPLEHKALVDILYPAPAGTVPCPVDDLMSVEEARTMLRAKTRQLFWQVDDQILNPLVEIFCAALAPNLRFDRQENDRRIEAIIERYPSEVIRFAPGDVLVPFGTVLDERDVLLLNAYYEEHNYFSAAGPRTLFAILLVVVLYALFFSNTLSTHKRRKPPYGLHSLLMLAALVFMKAGLLLTPYPVQVLPISVIALILVLLNQEKVVVACTALAAAVLVTLFTVSSFDTLLYFGIGGLVAVLASSRVHKRIHILFPSCAVGIFNAVFVLVTTLDWPVLAASPWLYGVTEVLTLQVATGMGWALVGGVVAGPLALAVLPLFDISSHTTSTFKLNRYADLQQPLLRDLLTKTPGTYQHSMSVAYLCQAVAEAVGGVNSLMVRIGAYYHDIGKMMHPKLFVENQFGAKNPHDDMEPHESARIIISHVQDGAQLARAERLPDAVVDLIAQHHGTQLLEFFYEKSNRLNGDPGDSHAFRYPGPKPQTLEAAILMIVDAVEAASRTLQEPTREKIDSMVRRLIEKRVTDGQFDECDVPTRDLARIAGVLVDAIEASFHSRVAYPWQEEQEGAAREPDVRR